MEKKTGKQTENLQLKADLEGNYLLDKDRK